MPASQQWQAEIEEEQFFTCLRLYQIAARGERFNSDDLKDLGFFLGISNYFKGDSHAAHT